MGEMRRLSGGAAWSYRSTDHSAEIAWLRHQALTAHDRQAELTYLVAAELLQSHDETAAPSTTGSRAARSSNCCWDTRSSTTTCDESQVGISTDEGLLYSRGFWAVT